MKSLTSILSMLLISAFSLSVNANTLTPDQESLVIQELNDFCADSWCESAIEFNFQKIECSDTTATCNLYFTTQDNSTNYTPIYNQVCQLTPLKSFEQMVSVEKFIEDGFRAASLKDGFVEQVNNCAEKFFR